MVKCKTENGSQDLCFHGDQYFNNAIAIHQSTPHLHLFVLFIFYASLHALTTVSLQDIQMRKAFKSSFLLDQEVVASHTLPSAMRDTYMRCEKPPKLSILTPYR